MRSSSETAAQQLLNQFANAGPVLVCLAAAPARGRVRHGYLLLRQVRHPRFVPPPLPPQVVVRCVHGQAVQPRLEHFRRSQLIQGIIQPDKDLLPDILDVLGTADQTGDRSEDSLSIGLNDLVERGIVAAASRSISSNSTSMVTAASRAAHRGRATACASVNR